MAVGDPAREPDLEWLGVVFECVDRVTGASEDR